MFCTLNCLESSEVRLYIAGTHMNLSDKNTIMSAVGKEKPQELIYTNPASFKEQEDVLRYFFDLKGVKTEEIHQYLLVSKKRLVANTVKFLSFEFDATSSLKKAFQKSYQEIKGDLKERFKKNIIDNPSKEIRILYISRLEKLLSYSFFFRDSKEEISFEDNIIDFMDLGIVNQTDFEGTIKCNLITDPLIIDVCKEILEKEFNESPIMKYIMRHFSDIIRIYGDSSTVKGNAFEMLVFSTFLSNDFQDKSLFELPFIHDNLKAVKKDDENWMKKYERNMEWLKKVKFNCKDFGMKELLGCKTDFEVLKNNEFVLLKPEDKMHPDGILCLTCDGKYYFLVCTLKISKKIIVKQKQKKNILSGDLRLIYIDKYEFSIPTPSNVELKAQLRLPEPTIGVAEEKHKKFFETFPPSKIGGVVRLLFEFDTKNDKDTFPIITDEEYQDFDEFGNLKKIIVPQVIIKITSQNMDTFFLNQEVKKYLHELIERLSKRVLEEKEEPKKKK